MRKIIALLVLFVVGFTASAVLAASNYTATIAQNYGNPLSNRFNIDTQHECILNYDGSGQCALAGDGGWVYFPPRSWDTGHVLQNGNEYDVTVPQLTYNDSILGSVTVSGAYSVIYFRGHYLPHSGGLKITVR
jgi:hypothetical protein